MASASIKPLTITAGGTYQGTWVSNDPNVPAVSVATSEPVIIQNSAVSGPGNLIWANCNCAQGIHLTVRNVAGTALSSGVAGSFRGNFVTTVGAKSLEVSRSTFTGVYGGVVAVNGTMDSLKITNNVVHNTQDHQNDGKGGLLQQRGYGHAVILTNIVAPNGAEIAWNELTNDPGKGSVEDMISIFNSQGGSAKQPISIHDNYLQGATGTLGAGYAGGGIITDGDGVSDHAPGVTAFVTIRGNQVVSTQNYGIGIAAGHDITVEANQVLSSGKTASGAWLGMPGFGTPAGFYLWNFYGSPNFFNNSIHNNTGALTRPSVSNAAQRSDLDVRSASTAMHNAAADNSFTAPGSDSSIPTHLDELAAYETWVAKLLVNRQSVGPTLIQR